jgi:hypothetical protein
VTDVFFCADISLCRDFYGNGAKRLDKPPWSDSVKGGKTMDSLIPLGVLALCIVFQAWLLRRLGVKT